MIDTRKNQLLQNQQVIGELQIDSGVVESQVEILKSEGVALSVIKELRLAELPEFAGSGGSILGTLIRLFVSDERGGMSDNQLLRRALNVFQSNLSVRRIGLTYVLEIGYTSPNPDMSAKVANGIADAYMVGELDARYQATKRASRWLQDRIQELRLQAQIADEIVQKFKSDNDIVGTNRGLMGDQQLGDVNTQLVNARASTAEAKAKLDRIVDISRGDLPDATVTDALRNEVITRLRAQYLDLAAKEADWATRYGPNHTAVRNLRSQMTEIKRSVGEELKRIAETYKSDYEIARAREQSLQESLAQLVNQAATTGQAQVKLRDLESSSQTSRNLYDTFLQRSMEATQQQTFPITDARVITAAAEPTRKSHPKSLLVLAGSIVAGLSSGFVLALGREKFDNSLRLPSDVESATGQASLGVIPFVQQTSPRRPTAANNAPLREYSSPLKLARFGIDDAFSRGAETLRSIKVEIDSLALIQSMKVIGFTSSLPREGKTTVAASLAQLVAHSGRKTVILDADMRNPSLTRTFLPNSDRGLIDILQGSRELEEVIWVDPETGLHLIPANLQQKPTHTAELVSSAAMIELLIQLRSRFDYVFVDLPPSLPVVDVKATASNIDGFIFLVEWGKTDREVVKETLKSSGALAERIIGIVLNKAPRRALSRVENYKGRYYRSYYA